MGLHFLTRASQDLNCKTAAHAALCGLMRPHAHLAVGLQVRDGDQAICVHAFTLMQPQLAPLGRVVEELRGRHEQALENVGQMAHLQGGGSMDGSGG